MPYKNKEDRKAYYKRHQKYYMVEFQKTHKAELNTYQNRYKKAKRKELGFNPEWAKVKANPIKHEKAKAWSRNYLSSHRDELNFKYRTQSKNLDDKYIIRSLAKEFLISRKLLKNCQLLIDIKRLILSIKREIKCQERKTKT